MKKERIEMKKVRNGNWIINKLKIKKTNKNKEINKRK